MTLTRRQFHALSAATVVAPTFAASRQDAPIRVALIGMGVRMRGMMRRDFTKNGFETVCVCDVEEQRAIDAKKNVDEIQGSDVAVYSRHEDAIESEGVDAVVIATPDHWHANQIIDAARAGKHVYCEKPLTQTLRESQLCIEAVNGAGVVFQTGSQQRTEFGAKFINAAERVRAGMLGQILTVHVGVGDPARPCDLPAETPDASLDWDRWLGPAPARPYHSELSPRGVHGHFPAWRRYQEYAGGGLADMGAHHFDIAQWCLGRDGDGPIEWHPPTTAGAKRGAMAIYEDGVRLIHGGRSGLTIVGTKGVLNVDRGRIDSSPANLLTDPLPEGAEVLPRPKGHALDWLAAIRGESDSTSCPVEVGTSSVAICQLFNLVYRHGRSFHWDPANWRFTNSEDNQFLDVPRRIEYPLPG